MSERMLMRQNFDKNTQILWFEWMLKSLGSRRGGDSGFISNDICWIFNSKSFFFVSIFFGGKNRNNQLIWSSKWIREVGATSGTNIRSRATANAEKSRREFSIRNKINEFLFETVQFPQFSLFRRLFTSRQASIHSVSKCTLFAFYPKFDIYDCRFRLKFIGKFRGHYATKTINGQFIPCNVSIIHGLVVQYGQRLFSFQIRIFLFCKFESDVRVWSGVGRWRWTC